MTQATHVDYNQECAVCHARLVLHPMFLSNGGPDFSQKVKCPGGQWVLWDAALGLVRLCLCCSTTLMAGSAIDYCHDCNDDRCGHHDEAV